MLNSAHPLYAKLVSLAVSSPDRAELLAAHIDDLARIAQQPLAAADMTAFLARSAKIMELL